MQQARKKKEWCNAKRLLCKIPFDSSRKTFGSIYSETWTPTKTKKNAGNINFSMRRIRGVGLIPIQKRYVFEISINGKSYRTKSYNLRFLEQLQESVQARFLG